MWPTAASPFVLWHCEGSIKVISSLEKQKRLGQVFTPEVVAQTLVRWVVEQDKDRLLDPACGDGRFITCHRASVGVEVDRESAEIAHRRAPWALIHEADFFAWASETRERFEAAAGNPPFIRYQHFSGAVRDRALKEAAKLGAKFNRLTSSWAPFLVVTAGLLKSGGRMAFVVPAEIGHAPYAIPVLDTLCRHFGQVQVIAVRKKIFPGLSEDAWLLCARGYGGHTDCIDFSIVERFDPTDRPPKFTKRVTLEAWRESGCRLRKFLLPDNCLALYQDLISRSCVVRFREVAQASIGYVSGANEFFHLRPSEAKAYGFPKNVLRVTIRKAEQLPGTHVDRKTVDGWLRCDKPVLLLDLSSVTDLPPSFRRYLNSAKGYEVREGYKCRNRDPWYVVPDVRVPDAFLSYMSGMRAALVRNDAGCVCTNSVHAVFRKSEHSIRKIQQAWLHPLVDLSCELEGHPLGGGMLKLEPREAGNIVLPLEGVQIGASQSVILQEAISKMRSWRHYA